MAADTRNNGIRITLLRNGDKHCLKKSVVNPRSTRTIDSFYNDVTTTLHMHMPVRQIFTPTHGHRIKDLAELKSDCSYVAAGKEPFKKIGYDAVREPLAPRLVPLKEPEVIVPAKHGKYTNVRGRARDSADSKPLGIFTIYVFCNGVISRSKKVMFPRNLKEMSEVLGYVNEKVSSVIGAVFYLYTTDGHRISKPSQLENKEHYVAVSRDGNLNRNVTYSDDAEVGQITPRRTSTKPRMPPKKIQPPSKHNGSQQRTSKTKSVTVKRKESVKLTDEETKQTSGSDDSPEVSPREYDDKPVWTAYGNEIEQVLEQVKEGRTAYRNELEEEQVNEEPLIQKEASFHGDRGVPLEDILNDRKQSDSGGSAAYEASGGDMENAQEIQDDQSEAVSQVHERGEQEEHDQVKPSVYEASGELQVAAAEIQDDRETKEDKPIDQLPAEEVAEEEIEQEIEQDGSNQQVDIETTEDKPIDQLPDEEVAEEEIEQEIEQDGSNQQQDAQAQQL